MQRALSIYIRDSEELLECG